MKQNLTNREEIRALWHMRWFFAIALIIWTTASIAGTLVAFCITKQPLSFALFSTLAPPVYLWQRLAKYLFTHVELEKIRIEAKRN